MMNSLLKIVVLLGMVATAQAECDHYETDGIAAASYTHRLYHDFRSLDTSGRLYNTEPANVTNNNESSTAHIQPGYLTSPAFSNDWGIQTWGSPASETAPLRKQYSNQNVYIQRDKTTSLTHLTLRAHRNKNFISTAEIDSQLSNILHASIRIHARVRGDPGACAGMFTYHDDNNESDIEILTRDPTNHIRYTNQPGLDAEGNEVPEASSDMVMGGGAVWTEWNNYRLDWTGDLSAWYLNGRLEVTKTYGIPREPSHFMVNMWGNGGKWWTGDMKIGDAAYLEIQWIEMLFNTSDASAGSTSRVRRDAGSWYGL